MLNDARAAFRGFGRRPGLAAAVIGVLALGIGVNVAVFHLAWSLLYRPLPYRDTERLLRVWGESRDGRTSLLGFSIPRFEHFRTGQRGFSDVAVDVQASFTLTGAGDPVQVNGRRVSANYFEVLGVAPLAERGFLREEEPVGGVAVITPRFWRDRLTGAPGALGRTVMLDGSAYTIVGVVPERPAADGGTSELYITRPYDVGVPPEVLQRGVSFLRFTGRLRDGVSIDEARAEMAALAESYRRDNAGKADADWSTRVVTIREDISNTFRTAVTTLACAVALVLLLACGNVAKLLTGHFLARDRDLAVRTALGASRWHALRQRVIETRVLSGAGAAVGLLLAMLINRVVPQIGAKLPLDETAGVPWSLLIAASVLGVLVGVATGVLSGLQSARLRTFDALRASRGGSGGRQRLQDALVSLQVAVSLVLLFSAALVTVSFRRVSQQNPGFDVTNVLTAAINPPPRRYPSAQAQNALYERLRERLENAPGVHSAALIAGLPLSGALSRAPYARADRSVPLHERPLGPTRSVTPGYFKTLGIPLRAGRDFTPRDDEKARPVVILSESTARQLYPDEDPIGRVVLTGSQNGGMRSEVVGVVGDVRSLTLTETTEVELYRPFAQRPLPFAQIAVRASGSAEPLIGVLRAVVREVDPELALAQVGSAERILGDSLGQRRLLMALLGAFAALASVVSALGIYAVVAFRVSRRVTEIGMRMALGANPFDVVRLIAGQGMRPVAAGAAIGLAALPWVSKGIAPQLFQVSPLNPWVIGVVVGLMVLVAATASGIPARRATRIDPVRALRTD
jgi:putative ABC transport system permease protein